MVSREDRWMAIPTQGKAQQWSSPSPQYLEKGDPSTYCYDPWPATSFKRLIMLELFTISGKHPKYQAIPSIKPFQAFLHCGDEGRRGITTPSG